MKLRILRVPKVFILLKYQIKGTNDFIHFGACNSLRSCLYFCLKKFRVYSCILSCIMVLQQTLYLTQTRIYILRNQCTNVLLVFREKATLQFLGKGQSNSLKHHSTYLYLCIFSMHHHKVEYFLYCFCSIKSYFCCSQNKNVKA